MLGRAIIVVFLLTVRPDQASPIPWLDMEQTKALFQLLVTRSSRESLQI